MKFLYLLLNVLLVTSVCGQNDDVNLERLSDYLAEGSDLARQGIQKLSQSVYETTIKKPIEAIASIQERLKPKRLFENMVQFVNKSVFSKRSVVDLVTLKNNSNVTDDNDDAVTSLGTNGKMLSSVINNENDYLLNQTNFTSIDTINNHSSTFHKTDFLFRKSHLTTASTTTTADTPTSSRSIQTEISSEPTTDSTTHLQNESVNFTTNNEEIQTLVTTAKSIDLETSSILTTVPEAYSSVSNESSLANSTSSTSSVVTTSSTVLPENTTLILTNPTHDLNLMTSTSTDSLESIQILNTNSSETFTTLLSINETTATHIADFSTNAISTSTTEPESTTTITTTTTTTTSTTTTTIKATTSINLEANNKIKLKIVNYTLIDSNSSMSSDSSASKSYSLRLHIKGYKWKEKFNNVSSLEAQEFLQRNILPLLYKNLNVSKDELNDIKLLRLFKENKNKAPE